MMLEFILKYWIQILFGLIVTAIASGFKYMTKQFKLLQNFKSEDQELEQQKKIQEMIQENISALKTTKEIQQMIDESLDSAMSQFSTVDSMVQERLSKIQEQVEALTNATLVSFSDKLKQYCISLLSKEYIYLDELETFQDLYEAYKNLTNDNKIDEFSRKIHNKKLKNRDEK